MYTRKIYIHTYSLYNIPCIYQHTIYYILHYTIHLIYTYILSDSRIRILHSMNLSATYLKIFCVSSSTSSSSSSSVRSCWTWDPSIPSMGSSAPFVTSWSWLCDASLKSAISAVANSVLRWHLWAHAWAFGLPETDIQRWRHSVWRTFASRSKNSASKQQPHIIGYYTCYIHDMTHIIYIFIYIICVYIYVWIYMCARVYIYIYTYMNYHVLSFSDWTQSQINHFKNNMARQLGLKTSNPVYTFIYIYI